MGGLGSGREGWLPTIEHGLTLDLRHLRQDGLFDGISALRSITLAWSNPRTNKQTASVAMSYSATPRDSWLKLEYTVTRGSEHILVKDTFRLERLEQPYGGYRWYFRCPQTGRRCQCLYLPPGATHFRSRQGFRCRLQYRSQHHGPLDRLLDRRARVAAKVLRAGSPEWREKYRHQDIAPKPKWMRQSTYDRLFAEWARYDFEVEGHLAGFREQLGGL
jgi:hypothetical protein